MKTRCECAWRLGILLAFVLVRHCSTTSDSSSISSSSTTTTEEPYAQYKGGDDKYDLVDVAQQHGETSEGETGHTSRFFTIGEVDDAFWLKHLGEDYKNAIHLQVGGNDPYNGIYNMTEDGSAYQVQHVYTTEENPVQGTDTNSSASNKEYAKETRFASSSDNNNTPADQQKKYTTEDQQRVHQAQTDHRTDSRNDTYRPDDMQQEQSFERVFTIDDMGFAGSIFNKAHNSNLNKYTNFQNIDLKYTTTKHKQEMQGITQSSRNHNNNDNDSDSDSDNDNNNDKDNDSDNDNDNDHTNKNSYSKPKQDKSTDKPVVVDLPATGKPVQLNEHETPVVVQMPPVIYHRKPSYKSREDNSEMPTQSQSQPQTQTETEAQPPTPTHIQAHSPTQTYIRGHNPDTHYTEYLKQHAQYQQQHQKYSQYVADYYKNKPTATASMYSDQGAPYSSTKHSATEPASATPTLRYIITKRATSPTSSSAAGTTTHEYGTDIQPQDESMLGYTDYQRVSRSSRALFEEGL